jgi:rhodanese domain protein
MEIKMKIKKIALMAIVGLISVLGISCGRTMNSKQVSVDSKEVKNEKKAEYKKITSDEAKNIMLTEKPIVVDVRSLEEYNEGHIPNAISIPLETIENEAETKLKNKDDLILVYCRSGRRSREAALRLIEKGYTNVIDFGGIQDWNGEVVK